MSQTIRLNKYLASQGLCSRRQADLYIARSKARINNRPAKLGDKVDPDTDTVTLGKKIIPPKTSTQLVYLMLNKPAGYLSTTKDDRHRPTVLDLVDDAHRLFPVGRLDYQSSGLILLTNDGQLANRLTHPRFHLPKTYLVTLLGKVSMDKIQQLRKGIKLEDGITAPAKVDFFDKKLNQTTLKITLYQGKKRQIRRMMAALHLYLTDLHRLSIASLELGELPSGRFRYLTNKEVSLLKKL